MSSVRRFTDSIRDALLRDEQLVRLLGGAHVFGGYGTEISEPHINICESAAKNECSGEKIDHEAIVTLHVWSHSGEKSRTDAYLTAAEQALAKAGFLESGGKISLFKSFAGARKLPDDGEFQGILRYYAERQSEAA